jgi:hypothetical protein
MIALKRNNFPILLLALALSLFTACGDDAKEPEPGNGVISLAAGATSFESGRGTSVDIPLTINAEEGIQSLTVAVDGAAAQTISTTAGQTTINANFSYDIPADALFGSSVNLVFKATDAKSQTSETTVAVTTGKLIDAPTTYAFTRNGETTVSYGGQNTRLDMVEIIKNEILKKGDKGEAISEQALLDAFYNTGDNGGGLFPEASTKKLGNKAFQPDLDDQLFENLFADAAAASTSGQTASNGVAGLITRESKGSTVLVDANGREFTQLIEKGIMGSVFYNQIYNTYFSEARTGDDVENTVLRDGKNYNDMEHHWDEAFGYWNPPVDFTSNWPSERASEDRFWSHYSNTVDPSLGTNSIIMNAFIDGRTAIVNNDLAAKTAQRSIVAENLELVAAATAVHYLNDALEALNAGNTGDAFHVMSEVWAFVNALKYNPNRKLSLEDIEEIKGQDLGKDGNFWNVTPEGLNKAKSTLVTAYPKLAPVQDDL